MFFFFCYICCYAIYKALLFGNVKVLKMAMAMSFEILPSFRDAGSQKCNSTSPHLTKLTVEISFEQLAFWPQITLAVKK